MNYGDLFHQNILKQLPFSLQEPAAIGLSKKVNDNNEKNLLLITDKKSRINGLDCPLAVFLRIDKDGLLIQRKGIFDHEAFNPLNTPENIIKTFIKDFQIIHTNPSKIATLDQYGIAILDHEKTSLNLDKTTGDQNHQSLTQQKTYKETKGIDF